MKRKHAPDRGRDQRAFACLAQEPARRSSERTTTPNSELSIEFRDDKVQGQTVHLLRNCFATLLKALRTPHHGPVVRRR